MDHTAEPRAVPPGALLGRAGAVAVARLHLGVFPVHLRWRQGRDLAAAHRRCLSGALSGTGRGDGAFGLRCARVTVRAGHGARHLRGRVLGRWRAAHVCLEQGGGLSADRQRRAGQEGHLRIAGGIAGARPAAQWHRHGGAAAGRTADAVAGAPAPAQRAHAAAGRAALRAAGAGGARGAVPVPHRRGWPVPVSLHQPGVLRAAWRKGRRRPVRRP